MSQCYLSISLLSCAGWPGDLVDSFPTSESCLTRNLYGNSRTPDPYNAKAVAIDRMHTCKCQLPRYHLRFSMPQFCSNLMIDRGPVCVQLTTGAGVLAVSAWTACSMLNSIPPPLQQ